MAGHALPATILLSCLAWADFAAAFRSCTTESSHAFAATTRYSVGELAFDADTGLAGGTETTYSYSNRVFDGFSECHVTYELSGSYEPVSRTFLLEARRTNHSPVCPGELIEHEYPKERVYSFQVDFNDQGKPVVLRSDNGDSFARATWSEGRAAYNTDEKCTIF